MFVVLINTLCVRKTFKAGRPQTLGNRGPWDQNSIQAPFLPERPLNLSKELIDHLNLVALNPRAVLVEKMVCLVREILSFYSLSVFGEDVDRKKFFWALLSVKNIIFKSSCWSKIDIFRLLQPPTTIFSHVHSHLNAYT